MNAGHARAADVFAIKQRFHRECEKIYRFPQQLTHICKLRPTNRVVWGRCLVKRLARASPMQNSALQAESYHYADPRIYQQKD